MRDSLFEPRKDSLRVAKFSIFALAAVVVMIVGAWITADPQDKYSDDLQAHGMAAVVASFTGLAGLGVR